MYNLVLLVPDDLPPGVTKQPGNVEEMKLLFEGWDPVYAEFDLPLCLPTFMTDSIQGSLNF